MSGLGMFCFQCEQTRHGKYCSIPKGVCEKTPEVAALQDLLVEVGKRVSSYAYLGSTLGQHDPVVNRWVLDAYFSTLTNVNFDPKRMENYLKSGAEVLKRAKQGYFDACAKAGKVPEAVANGDWELKPNLQTMAKEGRLYGIDAKKGDWNTTCVKELAVYGMKGGIAYLHHAMKLGYEDNKIYSQGEEILHKLRGDMKLDEALALAIKVGTWDYKVMELLDKANTESYGVPEITQLRITPVKGKCIVVSGHDLKDLDLVLRQTVGKNINVYTHGEMLPCNAYPKFKKYKQLVGNYGGAWFKQRKEFADFPGSILMTSNCLISPRKPYAKRIFTRSVVGWPGLQHIEGDDMTPLIKAAENEPGFKEDAPKKEITIGFARNTIMKMAPLLIDAVKTGAIKHFFVVGGCDGFETKRSYYREFVKIVPKDCVVLTLACGKFQFNYLDLGHIDFKGKKIPRLLDLGQCNDTYSGIQVALALSKAFNKPVNDLPLSFVITWFEQKAVADLLALLSFDVHNIILGPTLPGYFPPDVLKILMEKYKIRHISTPEADLKFLLERNK